MTDPLINSEFFLLQPGCLLKSLFLFCFLFFYFILCLTHSDSEDRQVQLITTLDNTEVDLLTLEYIKVCDDIAPKLLNQSDLHNFSKTVRHSKDFCYFCRLTRRALNSGLNTTTLSSSSRSDRLTLLY